jgi:transcriptional regulator with XRE-family HTH domain
MKPNNYDLKISKSVKTYRTSYGKCQKEIAFVLKITVSYYNKFERGSKAFTCGQLQLIAQYLDIPVGNLMPDK